MTKKPKREPEFKLQTDDDRMDDLAAEVLSIIRAKARTPGEAMAVLELVFYMICKGQRTNAQEVKEILSSFVSDIMVLHTTNDIQGTA